MSSKNLGEDSIAECTLRKREVSCLQKAEMLVEACQRAKTPEDRADLLELLDGYIESVNSLIAAWKKDGIPVPDDLPGRFENVKEIRAEF
ncbi:hypothetical protein CL630_00135 [bacterium]|nr:hypothetical protein [bacterium]|tara:strand:- start:14917 stop:15186 length:270 start_codon:yes stop_codon:yes gene_type:complete